MSEPTPDPEPDGAPDPGPAPGRATTPTPGPLPDALDPAVVARDLRAREPLTHREPCDADRAHFESLLAPGMVWVGASGRQLTREAYLESTLRRYARGAHGDDHTWRVEEFAVERLAPGLWAATYVLHQGDRVSRRFTLWRRDGDRWRALRHQGTPVAPGVDGGAR